jgi:hypothetical protein
VDISATHVGLVLSQAGLFKKCIEIALAKAIRIQTELTSDES